MAGLGLVGSRAGSFTRLWSRTRRTWEDIPLGQELLEAPTSLTLFSHPMSKPSPTSGSSTSETAPHLPLFVASSLITSPSCPQFAPGLLRSLPDRTPLPRVPLLVFTLIDPFKREIRSRLKYTPTPNSLNVDRLIEQNRIQK